ncbi:MAG: TonB-dependent receptor [Kiritimatiellia bacterium]
MLTNLLVAASLATNLPPIVVEASRLERTSLELPQFVETLSRDRIAASGARDATELLEHVTGVGVRRLGGENPALAQIAMRGYGENSFGRALVVVDGERLNNPDMSAPNLSRIDLGSIDHVEVLHGPQTVLHGDNASAGLVNIVTKPADYTRRTTAELRVGSWDTYGGTFSTKGGFADEGVAYWGNFGWLDSAGFRDRSDYTLWNASAGVRQNWENAWLRVSTFYSNAEYDLPGGLSRRDWKHHPQRSTYADDYARFYTYGLNTTGYSAFNDENALKLEFTASHRASDAHYDYPAYGYDFAYESGIYSFGLTPQYIRTARIGAFDNTLTVGGTVRYDVQHGRERSSGSLASLDKPDRTRWVAGAFVQDEFFLTDELSFVLGARLERAMARNEQADKAARNDNLCAYESAVNWRPVEEAKLFARWCRFYRNPFLDETPWYTNPRGLYVPKDILSPERGYSVDWGGEWTFLDDFNVGGVLFVSETKNEVFYDAGRYANVNSDDKVLRQGLEGHVGWEREKVAGLHLRYALVSAKFEEGAYNSKYVPLVPLHQIRLDGRVWLWDECFVRGGYQYCAKQVSASDFSNRYDRIPDYGIFNVGVQYEPSAGCLRGFVFAFDVSNLFDRNYANYSTYGSSYYPGAGRCCTFTVRYSF